MHADLAQDGKARISQARVWCLFSFRKFNHSISQARISKVCQHLA